MKLVPENAQYILGVIPDSVLLLAIAFVYGLVWYRLFLKG